MLNLPTTFIIGLVLMLQACGGGCPAVAIPLYEVEVYDSETNEELCGWGLNGDGNCDFDFDYTSNGQFADITVSLGGYLPKTQTDVPNESGKHRCFDQYSYTQQVVFYLERLPVTDGLISPVGTTLYENASNGFGHTVITNSTEANAFITWVQNKGLDNTDAYVDAINTMQGTFDRYSLVIYQSEEANAYTELQFDTARTDGHLAAVDITPHETTDGGPANGFMYRLYKTHKWIQEIQFSTVQDYAVTHQVILSTLKGGIPVIPLNCKTWQKQCNICIRGAVGSPLFCDSQVCDTDPPEVRMCLEWFSPQSL